MMDQKQLKELTGARFCAAAIVMLGHFQPLSSAWLVEFCGRNRTSAVGFFFVLSGFVLSINYAPRLAQRSGWQEIRDFWQARFARIYPVYLLVLLAACPIMLWCLKHSPELQLATGNPTRRQLALALAANAALIHIYVPHFLYLYFFNAPAWSIATEAIFYLAFPFFAALFLSRLRSSQSLIYACIAFYGIEAAALLLGLAALHLGNHDIPSAMARTVYMWPPFRIWEFFIGCCIGKLYTNHALGPFGRRSVREAAMLVSIAWCLAVTRISSEDWPQYLRWYVLDTPAFCLAIFALATGPTIWTQPLANRATVLLGEASYSLYLIHRPIARWCSYLYPSNGMPAPAVILAVLACITLSLLCFNYIEVPARSALRPPRRQQLPGSAQAARNGFGPDPKR